MTATEFSRLMKFSRELPSAPGLEQWKLKLCGVNVQE